MKVEWTASGADVEFRPLDLPEHVTSSLQDVAIRALEVAAISVIPLLGLRAFEWIAQSTAVAVMLSALALGALLQVGIWVRRRASVLVLRIRPHRVELEHRIAGTRIATQVIDLDQVRGIEVDDGKLVFRRVDTRSTIEPIPALDREQADWLATLLSDARSTSDDFWRDQLEQAAAQAQVRALAESVSRTR